MDMDIRAEAAKYYDLNPQVLDDISFYKKNIPLPNARILELGYGTGRVLVPLVESSGYIHGIDLSDSMSTICRMKLKEAGIPPTRACIEVGDITNFSLGQKFDLIIAPNRVFQNLETDADIDGVFRCIRQHLAPSGTCILNAFKPIHTPEALRQEWCSDNETFYWKVFIAGGYVTCHDRRPRLNPEKLVLYPELIYRKYREGILIDEAVLKIVLRCYYPDQFEKLIIEHGFTIINRWGGYKGEAYGNGPELVIQFKDII